MDETQAVLDFFAQAANLSLALSVAEQVDGTRQQLNNQLWRGMADSLSAQFPQWTVQLTEDRNQPDSLVGLFLEPLENQTAHLRPMLEQQLTHGEWRIYVGLMWNTPPAADKLALKEINELRDFLNQAGYQSNERFLAWRWTTLYPRRRGFLLQMSEQPTAQIENARAPLLALLNQFNELLNSVHTALRSSGKSAVISLAQLHRK